MSNYDYILLDWDGNLAKTLDLWLDATREVLLKRGINVTDEQIGASFGAFIAHSKEWGVVDPEQALQEADQIAKQKLPDVDLYPDALEVLENLHAQNKHLALITSSPHENVKNLLIKYRLNKFFEVIVAADDTTNHKPHPEPLEKALAALGGQKEKAIMIGDSDKDILAAHSFGIDSILFFPLEHKKFYDFVKLKELEPTHIVEDFRDVLNLV